MKHKENLKEKDEYAIKEEDLGKEVKFEIDKNAFNGPFTCHGKKTNLGNKKISFNGIEFNHSVWQCKVCKKEYLDSEQGRKLERFWLIKKMLDDNLISIERNLNYDGKAYFFRLPKELTKDMHKGDLADIKLLSLDGKMFLVEIRPGK